MYDKIDYIQLAANEANRQYILEQFVKVGRKIIKPYDAITFGMIEIDYLFDDTISTVNISEDRGSI